MWCAASRAGFEFILNEASAKIRYYLRARSDYLYLQSLNDYELHDIGLTRADVKDDAGIFDDPTVRFQARREERLNRGPRNPDHFT